MAAIWTRAALALGLSLAASGAWAVDETRCGWFDNPSPGNFFLTDADSDWVIALQGGPGVQGFDTLPESSFNFGGDWVSYNGSYGFGCACIEGDFGHPRTGKIYEIFDLEPLAMSRCTLDRNLPPPPG